MKKIADLELYSFILLYQILRKKFKKYQFDFSKGQFKFESFEISATPVEKIASAEIFFQILNPVHPETNDDDQLDTIDISNKLTINFVATNVVAVKYQIHKKDLDNPFVIAEIKKIIGLIAPTSEGLSIPKCYIRPKRWIRKKIKESPLHKYLEEVK